MAQWRADALAETGAGVVACCPARLPDDQGRRAWLCQVSSLFCFSRASAALCRTKAEKPRSSRRRTGTFGGGNLDRTLSLDPACPSVNINIVVAEAEVR